MSHVRNARLRSHFRFFAAALVFTTITTSCKIGFMDVGNGGDGSQANQSDNGNTQDDTSNGGGTNGSGSGGGGGGGGIGSGGGGGLPTFPPRIQLSGANNIPSNTCISGYTATLLDNHGVATSIAADATIRVTAPAGLLVSRGSDCSSASGQFDQLVTAGSNSFQFSAKGTATGTNDYNITAIDPGGVYQASSFGVRTVTPPVDTTPVLATLTGPGTAKAGACVDLTLTLTNRLGTASGFSTAKLLALTGKLSGAFYLGAGCNGTGVTSINVAANTPTILFSYDNTKTELVNLTATIGGLSDSKVVDITADVPYSVNIVGAASFRAGDCVLQAAQVVDQYGNASPITLPEGVEITLAGLPSFSARNSATSCGQPVTKKTVAFGSSAVAYYVSTTLAGNYALTGSGAGLETGPAHNVTVLPAGANRIVIVPQGTTEVKAGACFAARLKIVDIHGNENPMSANSSFTLSHALTSGDGDSGAFSANSTTCGVELANPVELTAITINSGQALSPLFGYRNTKAQSVRLTASRTTLVSGEVILNIGAATAERFVFTPVGTSTRPFPIGADDCGEVRVQVLDAFDNLAAFSDPSQMLAVIPTSGHVFATSACDDEVNRITALSGPKSLLGASPPAKFFFKHTVAGTHTVTVRGTGINESSVDLAVEAGAVARVILEGSTTVMAGKCTGPYRLKTIDRFENVAKVAAPPVEGLDVQLAGRVTSGVTTVNWNGAFFSSNNCASGTMISTRNIAVGASASDNFYLQDNVAETVSVLMTPPLPLRPSSIWLSVVPAGSIQLDMVGPNSLVAGSCTPYDLVIRDIYGNVAPPASPLAVTLVPSYVETGITANAGNFYLASDCNEGSKVNNTTVFATIYANAQLSRAYYRGTVANYMVAVASAVGYVSAKKPFVVRADAPHHLAAVTPPSVLTAGVCTALITLRVLDQWNNRARIPGGLELSLSGAGRGQFYSNSACTSDTSHTSVGEDSDSAVFYFKNTAAQNLTLVAAGGGLRGEIPLEIRAGTPSAILLASAGGTRIRINTCSNFDVRIADCYGNVIKTPVPSTFGVSIGGSGRVSTAVNCVNPGASSVQAPADLQGVAPFSAKNSVNQIVTIRATHGNLGTNLSMTYFQDCAAGYRYITNGCMVNVYYASCSTTGAETLAYQWSYRACGCFSPDTKIAMAGGLNQRADTIVDGQEVWNPILKKPMVVKRVIAGVESLPLIELGYGSAKVKVSTKHIFLTLNGARQAKELRLGDRVLGPDGKYHSLTVRKELPYIDGQMVYNFELDTKSMRPEEHVLLSDGIVSGDYGIQTLFDKGYLP